MSLINQVMLVAIGGFFGAICRFGIAQLMSKRSRQLQFPFGTIIVNLLGAFVLGWLFASEQGELLYTLMGVGYLGAFTTFSTIKLELFKFAQHRKYIRFLLYSLCTYTLGLLFAFCGFYIGSFNH